MNRVLLIVALVLAILSALLFLLSESGGHASAAGSLAAYFGSQL